MKNTSLLTLLFLVSFYANGQDRVWKKEVSRIIDVKDVSSKNQKRTTGGDICSIIVAAIKNGSISPYSNLPSEYLKKMTSDEIKDQFFTHTDTMTITDPVTGDHKVVTTISHLSPEWFYKYKIYEEWTFNPATGKINIEIKYIGPMGLVYGNDGMYRGKQTFFWITYTDFVSLMEQNNKKKLLRDFSKYLWQSYFGNGISINTNSGYDTKTGMWQGTSVSGMEFRPKVDESEHFLVQEDEDTVLSKIILSNIQNNKMPAWPATDLQFQKQLTTTEFNDEIDRRSKKDTQTVIDPVTDDEKIVITRRLAISGTTIYNILEDWSFNPATGKTEIAINGIAPSGLYGNNGITVARPIFWIRYSDLQPTLNRIEQYHPDNTFAMHIWNSFFLSDVTPVLVK